MNASCNSHMSPSTSSGAMVAVGLLTGAGGFVSGSFDLTTTFVKLTPMPECLDLG